MYDLTICSIFRNSGKYASRYLQQVTQAFELNGGKCRAVWLEGDSVDGTYELLVKGKQELEEKENVNVTLIKFNIGGIHWPSIINPDRWLQIATCWNKCLDALEPSKITISVESDLMYDPSIIKELAKEIDEKHHVIYPMLMAYDGTHEETPEQEWFHDTWGMSRENEKFKNLPPYWSSSNTLIEEENLLQITTGGGMIVSTYEYQKQGKFDTTCCIMKYPKHIKLFMHKKFKIYHPMPHEEHWWPSLYLRDWENSQSEVRNTRKEKEWFRSQALAWRKAAQQAQNELEECRRQLSSTQSQLEKTHAQVNSLKKLNQQIQV